MDQAAVIMVYVTYPSEASAAEISTALLDEGLAACANIMPAHRSLFRWEGAVQDVGETAVIYKTRGALFDALAARVSALHSYECPCIVSLPVEGGFRPFLEWIIQETQQGDGV